MKNKNIILFSSLCMLAGAASAQTSNEKPNIIFILCDDMGYGDLGCYGQQYISTPNLDRMAAEGMRFTQAYAGSPVSAPSRASLMTGQHTGHTKVRGNKEYRIGNVQYGQTSDPAQTGQEPYDPDHIILPEIMKDQGYTTGMFGKWAGGYEGSESTPEKRGVDEYYGYICQFQAHLYYPNFMNRLVRDKDGNASIVREELTDNTKYPMYGNGYENRSQYTADLIHQEALKWLDKQTDDQPFYGLFTYTLPHAELYQPNDSILQAYNNRFCNDKNFAGSEGSRYNPSENVHAQFAAMITRLDAYVGEILAKLKEKGMDENTIVIFSSDNGPHEEGGADPTFFNRDGLLKGTKRSCFEGGIRIPFIVRWPGKIQAGSVNDHQLAFYDVMPTFCDLIGVEDYVKEYTNPKYAAAGKEDYFDGISFLPTLFGNDEKQEQHDFLYWEFHETNQMAVRKGNWKLRVNAGNCELYDLANDLHEDNNVAAKYPEVVKELKAILFKEHTDSPLFKVTLPAK